MRTDIIPKHITIDTRTLITLFIHPYVSASHFANDVMKYQNSIWNAFFDVSMIKRAGYVFDHTLITDGFVASVRLMDSSLITKKINREANKKEGRRKQRETGQCRQVIESTEDEEVEGSNLPPPRKTSKSGSSPKQPEFLYLDEVDRKLLTKAERTFVIDCGKRKLLTMMDTKTKAIYSYTNCQRLHETKRLAYHQKLQASREKTGILAIEEEMSGYNSKTCHSDEFLRYMVHKIEVNERLYPLYETPIYRQYRWYGYLNNIRSDQKLVETLTHIATSSSEPLNVGRKHRSRRLRDHSKRKRKRRKQRHKTMVITTSCVDKMKLKLKPSFKSSQLSTPSPPDKEKQFPIDPKEVVLLMGDWSVGKQMRNFISTPNARLMRLLSKYFRIYYLDEFRTSCLHWKTEEKCGHLELPDGKGKMRSRHSILTYQMENKRLGCIDRDRNACMNMNKLYRSYCSGQDRPYRYRRGVKLDET
jgi:hypothetical protein